MRISDAIRYKGSGIHEVDAGESIASAARRMLEQRVRSLVVTEAGQVRGIVTTTDLLRVLLEGSGDVETRPLRELMGSKPVTVRGDVPLSTALELFSKHGINHIIVQDEDRLVGVLTPADILNRLTEHLSFLNQHLQDYVQGSTPSIGSHEGAQNAPAPAPEPTHGSL